MFQLYASIIAIQRKKKLCVCVYTYTHTLGSVRIHNHPKAAKKQ